MEQKTAGKPSSAPLINDGMARGWMIGSWGGYIAGALIAKVATGISISGTLFNSALTMGEAMTALAPVAFGASVGMLIAAPALALAGGLYRQHQMKKEGKEQETPTLTDHAVRGLALGSALAVLPELISIVAFGGGYSALTVIASISSWVVGGAVAAYNVARHWNDPPAQEQVAVKEQMRSVQRGVAPVREPSVSIEEMQQLQEKLAKAPARDKGFAASYMEERGALAEGRTV